MIKVLVLGSSTLFIVSLGGIAFFLIGDQSTNLDPTDADYLWRSNQVLIDNEAAIGRASLAVGLLSAFTLALLYSRDRIKGHTLAQVGVLSAFALWLGALYRVVTAGVIGANIGGGMMLLGTPVVAIATIALVFIIRIRSATKP